ncbi:MULTISPECIES: hypothetical protein [unclassified Aureimonas]|uniref:hypothetical protein n=1 Tax=unclassified Aureimonas TaxID=2615206 RepID=UPI000702009E|nr:MULTISPECIES: hypothetical protein [unclassified Aureimonas]KQT64303.1 hypothetical protein ASG62_04765 [Aureimonas sp. Leaf427]KQT81492.1 hypothetical protein ASG54_02030 [Aureimonas sp. Leaf460]
MSLFLTRPRPLAGPAGFALAARLRGLWRGHQHRKAARASLEVLLDRRDDHLLEDIGIDRATAHRLLDETLVQPHRGWDRWQL